MAASHSFRVSKCKTKHTVTRAHQTIQHQSYLLQMSKERSVTRKDLVFTLEGVELVPQSQHIWGHTVRACPCH